MAASSGGGSHRIKVSSEGELVSLEFASKEVMAEVLGRVSAFSENKDIKGEEMVVIMWRRVMKMMR